MHKPLSYSVYIRSNKKKTAGMIISIGLGIFLIAVIQFFTNNMFDTYSRGNIQYEYMSNIWSTKGNIPKNIMTKIENSDYVEKIIKVNSYGYMINNILGSDADYSGYSATESDIKYIMEKMNLKLEQGKLSENADKEIIINENIARSRKLKIGDYMGSDVSQFDWFPSKYKISGIMKGNNVISFISISEEEINSSANVHCNYLIIPKSGKLNELNKFLNTLPKEGINLMTLNSIQNDDNADMNNFNIIFNIVIIVMIVVLSITLGNSAYVHYYQRRMEFGLLAAAGFRQIDIIFRAFKEIFISCLIGFITGFLFIEIFMVSMNKLYIYPHGLGFLTVKADLIIRIIAIPIFICVFSLIPISILLSKIEPISIIERNE